MGAFKLLHLDENYATSLLGKCVRFDYLRTGEIRTGWVLQADIRRCLVSYEPRGKRAHYILWGDVVEIDDSPKSVVVND